MDNQSNIETLLNQQVQRLEALQSLLNDELEALKKRDLDQITAIAEKKSELLVALQGADNELAPLLSSAQDPSHDEARQQIEAMLNTCKQLNEINGQALQLSMAGLARLQNMLANVKNEASGMTYDQSGKARPGGKLGQGIKV
ncbi:flagellar protein FlgN [Corallincola platygyrae]|uniref:Flagellar protein FlgN n=1 Tax=Corallincola platygyrae TaxID=1193278 RepID=A0ABW4XH50_9GAMM